ncbi:hypothetical protein [Sorangium sp. So ce1153]|uniref:hypothetical protein n=1 Tax=Sorangium sp. So ce1153 TaxID=3133333 RepID=UPI003F5E4E1F
MGRCTDDSTRAPPPASAPPFASAPYIRAKARAFAWPFSAEISARGARAVLTKKPSGRGLLLIRNFMDEVRHNEKGNEIRRVMRCRSPESEGEQDGHDG